MAVRNWWPFRRRAALRVFYDEAYRLPVSGAVEAHVEVRRADEALQYLLEKRVVSERAVVRPSPASYAALARTHTGEYLDSLHSASVLAGIFAADPAEISVDEIVRSLRIACGGTLEGARWALACQGTALNLFGGFHHAAPDRGAGFCALNDVAVAIAALRAEGVEGRICVLDFDFHPPDGTAQCLLSDASVWQGSISGADWGPLPNVDETVLPPGATDSLYLAAVEALLNRMPKVHLAFVLAGGDVLAGDRLGQFALSLQGIRRRDLLVHRHLRGVAQVWLPAGGYSRSAWKILAGTGLVLARDSGEPIAAGYDPLAARMSGISRTLKPEALGSQGLLSEDELAEALGQPKRGPPKMLGFYSAEGLEYALERYGVLPVLRRLGYEALHVALDRNGTCDRARLSGQYRGAGQVAEPPVTLVELEVERRHIGDGVFLFVNWLSLRNPRAQFSALRPQMPGQEVPGLGLAREFAELLGLMAQRLGLDGVAFRPSWYHMAFAARHSGRFLDPKRQGRFEAMMRDLKSSSLLEATRAVAEGRVLLNGRPYEWEADEMVSWREPHSMVQDAETVRAEREQCAFVLAPNERVQQAPSLSQSP